MILKQDLDEAVAAWYCSPAPKLTAQKGAVSRIYLVQGRKKRVEMEEMELTQSLRYWKSQTCLGLEAEDGMLCSCNLMELQLYSVPMVLISKFF